MGETLVRRVQGVRLAQAIGYFSLSYTYKCKMIDDSPICSSTDCVIRCNDTILGYVLMA